MSKKTLSFTVAGSLLVSLAVLAAAKPVSLAAPTKQQIEAARKAGKMHVELKTVKGDIVLELDGKAAPITVANFVNLVNAGFYDGMPFHRVDRDPPFVIQAGDPLLVGKPPVNYTIPDEKSPLRHDKKGALAMARLYQSNQMVPNSASTQFYITLDATPHLDRYGFTVFGHVSKGLDVVEKIRKDDKIIKATVMKEDAK